MMRRGFTLVELVVS
ncbi:MAG TPA: prepilin-type N-terminal cleavage/methylation domain-containing protein, partial [Phycisphaerales bacterium]|nr:prepilin-type N-terminal cleavage/methylation domain-containing protein [Phycisphaerales bacterium]